MAPFRNSIGREIRIVVVLGLALMPLPDLFLDVQWLLTKSYMYIVRLFVINICFLAGFFSTKRNKQILTIVSVCRLGGLRSADASPTELLRVRRMSRTF